MGDFFFKLIRQKTRREKDAAPLSKSQTHLALGSNARYLTQMALVCVYSLCVCVCSLPVIGPTLSYVELKKEFLYTPPVLYLT